MIALARKHLDPVLQLVGHNDVARAIHGDAMLMTELAIALASLPELADKRPMCQ